MKHHRQATAAHILHAEDLHQRPLKLRAPGPASGPPVGRHQLQRLEAFAGARRDVIDHHRNVSGVQLVSIARAVDPLMVRGACGQVLGVGDLTGVREIAVPSVRRKGNGKKIVVKNATGNNLRGVTASFPLGTFTCVTGVSGGGKSTLAALVPRFYNPDSGAVLLDGHDLQSLPMRDLRRNIAYVSQDVLLFNDTVAANIAYGDMSAAPMEAIEAAARAANALDFIQAMPEGFNTVIGENGNRLSGGQRQRLAIARAILKNAPILVLDEATSALDNESERVVQEALERLMTGRTTLVIAHRLSTVENADLIVVLANGKIVESGHHAELLGRNAAYSQLYRLQFSEAA